jgi:hypothetical protein
MTVTVTVTVTPVVPMHPVCKRYTRALVTCISFLLVLEAFGASLIFLRHHWLFFFLKRTLFTRHPHWRKNSTRRAIAKEVRSGN